MSPIPEVLATKIHNKTIETEKKIQWYFIRIAVYKTFGVFVECVSADFTCASSNAHMSFSNLIYGNMATRMKMVLSISL